MKCSVFSVQCSDKTADLKSAAHDVLKTENRKLKTACCFAASPAFSLMEMLFAIFILAIGLIMVAGVFPVAIKWTADDAQSTVGSVIAQNALSTIEQQIQFYESTAGGSLTPANCYSQCYTGTYWGSRSYAFGTSQPDVASSKALYYWTAYLQSISSGSTSTGFQGMSSSSLYRIYIFVFAKGDPNNVYTAQTPGGVYQSTTNPTGYTPSPPTGMVIYPQLASGAFNSVKASSGATYPMPIGSMGLDISSTTGGGTIFRQTISATGTITTVPSATATNNDTVIYAPAATGNGSVSSTQTDSPLIYIYTGTVSF